MFLFEVVVVSVTALFARVYALITENGLCLDAVGKSTCYGQWYLVSG